MRILVAEVDAGLREILVLGLEDQGYRVDAVERGDDAIDQLKFYDYDVAVLDWRMPGAEGLDVVRSLRRQHARPRCSCSRPATPRPIASVVSTPARTTTS